MRLIFQICSTIFTLGNLMASLSQSPEKGCDLCWRLRLCLLSNPAEVKRTTQNVQSLSINHCRSEVNQIFFSVIQKYALTTPRVTVPYKCQKDVISTTIINFNNEKMQITWAARELFPGKNVSFYYTFEGKQKDWKICPTYLLAHGYNSGCLFKTEGHTLAFSIKNSNGSEELFSKQLKSDFYIKPNRPENVTFFWKDDTVTVTCKKPERGVRCLSLELQYKSKFDKEWQSRTSKCCRVEDQGFDPRKCYSFRVRLKRLVPFCNVVDYSSDWEAETFWMNSTLLDSCDDDINTQSNTVILSICLMAVLLKIFILFILLCKWQRVQKSVMPTIPDPKYIFADLFNDHNGNFQEWIDKTNHAMVQTKLEYEDPECIIEEESQQTDKKKSDKQEPREKIFSFSGAAGNNSPKGAQNAFLMLTSNNTVSFAGLHNVMNDDMYVML